MGWGYCSEMFRFEMLLCFLQQITQQGGPQWWGPSQTVSRYAGRAELFWGWQRCLTVAPRCLHEDERPEQATRATQECATMRITLPASFLVSPIFWLCCTFINSHEEKKPAGHDNTFPLKAVRTPLLQQCSLSAKLGKQAACVRKLHASLIKSTL